MYSYDRTKTAATIDLHDKWADIVKKHRIAEAKELEALLKECVNYLKSVGFDLDVSKSSLGKEEHGSDGTRMTGWLTLTERPENTVPATNGRQVAMWVEEATGLHGSATAHGPGVWVVDISQS